MLSNKTKKTSGRCLALFPGAFRPPHQAHYATACNLACRSDIDEVIIIITNRCRLVPGTTKVLDTDVAERIWSIYLHDIPKIRVEVAPYSAVKHAIGYFERTSIGDKLLFCAGEGELKQGQGRFNKINVLSQKFGIAAQVIASPVPVLSGGATSLRTLLAAGISGRRAFMAALPKHLTTEQRAEVWQICYLSTKDIHDVARVKIRSIIEQQGIGEIEKISLTKNAKADAIYCVQLKSGKRLYVKYANDTVKAAKLGQPLSLKPRSRLYAERRALKWLASHDGFAVKLPEVIHFQNNSKTLILSEVSPNHRFLEEDLKQGIFDPKVAKKASGFLAQCHRTTDTVPPFWGDKEADLQHWKNLLHLRTLYLQSNIFSASINQNLDKLKCASEKATRYGFFHLDYCPKNIRLNGHYIGVIDFELSSNIGDPAYDFGFLLGHYIYWGVVTSSVDNCLQFLYTAAYSYREVIGNLWPIMVSRIIAFAGATIIHKLHATKHSQQLQKRLLNIASMLLTEKLDADADINLIFYRVISNELPH
jgi:aminoglycoside phosphotransferase (APT) family kinase protein